ncbi:MAG: YdcF family protein, partial [Halofilum sp. (in: g-proteobacteria)]|nr:YdcF family protein [Halofilum sp. (in: g-proteobacteria)]
TRELLQQLGVPRAAVATRGGSRSTRDDALAVSAELERRGLEDVLLVTSALHMPRALATFQALNVQAWPAPTDHEVVAVARSGSWSWLPYPWAFALSNRAWHEYVGTLYYRLRGWI